MYSKIQSWAYLLFAVVLQSWMFRIKIARELNDLRITLLLGIWVKDDNFNTPLSDKSAETQTASRHFLFLSSFSNIPYLQSFVVDLGRLRLDLRTTLKHRHLLLFSGIRK